MKTLLSQLLLLSAVFFTAAQSQSNSTAHPKLIQTVQPTCARTCSIRLIAESTCALTDTVCLCTNQKLLDAIQICASANCTIREQLTNVKFGAEFCDVPYVDNTKVVAIVGLVGGFLAYLAVGLRVWARLRPGNGEPGMDDLCMVMVALLALPATALSAVFAKKGLGLDIWEVPFDNITDILRIYWWDELMYILVLPLTKISILYFYLRIFTNKTFRRIVYIMMTINGIGGVVYVIVTIAQCIPIYGAWTSWDGTFVGHCNNIHIQAWTNGTFNLIMDIATILLPIPEVYKLHLPFRKKLHIFLMISVGFFATLISILRIRTLLEFANSNNFTQDYVTNAAFSTIEVHANMVCACMPAIRQLLREFFPSLMGSNNTPNNSTAQSGTSSKPAKPSSNVHVTISSQVSVNHDPHSSDHALVDLERQG